MPKKPGVKAQISQQQKKWKKKWYAIDNVC